MVSNSPAPSQSHGTLAVIVKSQRKVKNTVSVFLKLILEKMEKNSTQLLIDKILLLPTFTYKHFSDGKKLEEAKVGVDLVELHSLLNQFR